ncbi:D-cysteine desulfhydrase family protein [Roseovarius sp. EL26]|uniref:D-cysteine desulfhydrase family protein n=1 Tax=Roseovarius sp. EL26 TaxID=2126672 RepID=UPI000EA27B08|nr:D-cysteine desulfhydrase family protein [Roseovarius sp. EL26]
MTIETLLSQFPRACMGHLPTSLEAMPNLGAALGLDLWIKRDDCTGIGMGGNKVRQLEFYLGKAQAIEATQVLITGAVQSNFVRTTAAMAARLGMGCHIQLEERVPDPSPLYRENGNVLLNKLMGTTLYSYPEGEDETGADRRLREIAKGLKNSGEIPFIVPLSADHPPTGALGYIDAARELSNQSQTFDAIYIGSGSALTHCGLLFGLRLLGDQTPVIGICVRRDATTQTTRVHQRLEDLSQLLECENPTNGADIILDDCALAPGYGKMSDDTRNAITLAAQKEGQFLDPTYTGKVMAGLIYHAPERQRQKILFWHTGGQPAIFAYADDFGFSAK